MVNKQQLEANVDNILLSTESFENQKDQFCLIWSGTIKPALELVKNFTGPKADEQIDHLEKAADKVCSGTSPDVVNFCSIWNTFHIKGLLKTIQVFTGPKVDKAINKFIEISESFCPSA